MMAAPVASLRRLPPAAQDGLLAAAVAAVDISLLWFHDPVLLVEEGARGPSWLSVMVLMALTAPLVARRRAPHLVMLATVSVGVLAVVLAVPTQLFAPLVALYTVAAHRPLRDSLPWLAGAVIVAVVLIAIAGEAQLLLGQVVIVFTAWLLGMHRRALTDRDAALRERAEQLQHERERAAALAASEERTRIARELHDVLAHSLSLMVVQAGAARRVLSSDAEQARTAVTALVSAGRESLVELRHAVGRSEATAPFEPAPKLVEVDAIAERFRQAGLAVTVVTHGEPNGQRAGLELSGCRIIGEALTNVLKHAGSETSAEVTLHYDDEAVRIEVTDDGRETQTEPGVRGHGVIGMRERAELHGGTLEAGPLPGGGFRVTAVLPYEGDA